MLIVLPRDGEFITLSTFDEAGRVGGTPNGASGLSVLVNGLAATMDVGNGNNGTFLATGAPFAASRRRSRSRLRMRSGTLRITRLPSRTPTYLKACIARGGRRMSMTFNVVRGGGYDATLNT